ncbi:MAG: DUF5801 domain-containing protein, partial [Actinobacteria bacterium]|nr:DUF5801 domain-containing protein [Actinomycetota bacterium]
MAVATVALQSAALYFAYTALSDAEFTYSVVDESGNRSDVEKVVIEAQFTESPPITDNPVDALDDLGETTECGPEITGSVLTNDTLGDSPTPVTAASQNGSAITLGTAFATAAGGLLTLNADGSYSYTPPAQGSVSAAGLTETFSYTIRDNDGDSDTAMLTITVGGTDLGATVSGDIVTSDVVAAASGTDSDTAQVQGTGGSGSYSYAFAAGAVTSVAAGDFSIDASTGVVTFTQDDNYIHDGTSTEEDNVYSIAVDITDSNGNIVTRTVDVDITDDVPVASLVLDPAGSQQIEEGGGAGTITFNFDISGTTTGADGPGTQTTSLQLGGSAVGGIKETTLLTINLKPIYLQQTSDGRIVAFEQAGASPSSGDAEVFSLELGGSGTSAEVTLGTTVILHDKASGNDTSVTLKDLDINVVHTVEDSDGDMDSATQEIGSLIVITDTASDITGAEDLGLTVKYDSDGNLDTANSVLTDTGSLTFTSGVDLPETFSISGPTIEGLTSAIENGVLVYRDAD